MSLLSREQVEEYGRNLSAAQFHVTATYLLAHDAALRDLLRQREEEVALAIEQARSQERGYWEQQLAASQARVKELQYRHHPHCNVNLDDDGDAMLDDYQVCTCADQATEDVRYIRVLTARCAELEEALKIYRHEPNWQQVQKHHTEIPYWKWKGTPWKHPNSYAVAALTPTERPPACS